MAPCAFFADFGCARSLSPRCDFSTSKPHPLRTRAEHDFVRQKSTLRSLGASDRSGCGTVQSSNIQTEPSHIRTSIDRPVSQGPVYSPRVFPDDACGVLRKTFLGPQGASRLQDLVARASMPGPWVLVHHPRLFEVLRRTSQAHSQIILFFL